jgi:hypothetical protein
VPYGALLTGRSRAAGSVWPQRRASRPGWRPLAGESSSPADEWAVPAPLFATAAPIPQCTSGLDTQAGRRVEITSLATEQGSVMGVHHLHVVRSTNVQSIRMRGQHNWGKCGYALRTVQRAQYQPPRGQAVGAALGRGHQAIVGAAADPVGHPLGQGFIIWRRPAAVALEPRVSAPNCFCRASCHQRRIRRRPPEGRGRTERLCRDLPLWILAGPQLTSRRLQDRPAEQTVGFENG